MKPKPDFQQTSLCPHCGHKVDTGQLAPDQPHADTAVPKAGDYGICIRCAGLLVYIDNAGGIRKMTPQDTANIHPDTMAELINMRVHIQTMNR